MAFFDSFSGILGSLGGTLKWLLYLAPIVIFFAVIIIIVRNKLLYRYPVRIFRTREGGKKKECNFVGGYISRRNSAPFFRIKTGRMWWQYMDLIETPKIEYMDEQDRIYYQQIDVNTLIQLKREFNNNAIVFTPVESDVKYGAILSIQRIKDVLRVEPTWKKILPYFGLILLAVVFIIAYALLMNSCKGG